MAGPNVGVVVAVLNQLHRGEAGPDVTPGRAAASSTSCRKPDRTAAVRRCPPTLEELSPSPAPRHNHNCVRSIDEYR